MKTQILVVLSLVMMLQSCSINPSVEPTRDILIAPPDNMLIYPCVAVSAGKGVDTLMDGYVANNSCIEQWQNRMDSLVEWKRKNILLYEGGKDVKD